MLIPQTDPATLPRRLSFFGAVGGRFVQRADTFFVEEELPYLPCGDGEHLFVQFRKRNRNTREIVEELCKALGLPDKDIGVAGQKDRKATTTQWISLFGVSQAQLGELTLKGVEFLNSERHQHKLRNGQVKSNRFRIAIRDLDEAQVSLLTQMLAELSCRGLPNFFGPQRFGIEGNNRSDGRQMLISQTRLRSKWKQKMLLSSYQSALFNDLLAMRMELGFLDTILEGDLLKKHDTGGQFCCETPEIDQVRADAMELSPTGWMPGYKCAPASGEPGRWELALLAQEGITQESFRCFGKSAVGTRRPLRVEFEGAQVEIDQYGMCWVSFSLPSGSYASVLLHELGIEFAR